MLDWNAALESFRSTLPQTQFQNWFKPLQLIRWDTRSVTLGVPSRFHEEWLRSHYAEQLSEVIRQQAGSDLELEFELLREENAHAAHSHPLAKSSAQQPLLRVITTPKAEIRPPADDLETSPFDTPTKRPEPPNTPQFAGPYWRSGFNHMAYEVSQLFLEDRTNRINPILVIAETGMGKTHLLNEIGQQMFAADPTLRIRYTHAEAFTAEMVQSFRTNTGLDFKKKYREETDVLLFDDIAGLAKRLRTQEEFLHIFNEILGRGGKIAFTSPLQPHRLTDFIDPLRSRLMSAVSAEIRYPSLEERVMLLEQSCSEQKMVIDPNVLRSIADRGQKDIRELLGSLVRVHLQARLENQRLDQRYLAKAGFVQESVKEAISIAEIITLVENNFRVSRSDLLSKSRKSVITWARQVAMYLARLYTLMPLEEIGKTFGRDHATVIHAFQKVTETLTKTPSRRFEVEYLKNKIQSRGE